MAKTQKQLKVGDRVELTALDDETRARQLKKGDRGTVVFFQFEVPFVSWDRGAFNYAGKFVSALSGKWKYTDILAENVFRCEICGGKVHRYEHLFQCEDCFSIGDLNYGMMTESFSMIKISGIKNRIRRLKLSLDDIKDIDTDMIKVLINITPRSLMRKIHDLKYSFSIEPDYIGIE